MALVLKYQWPSAPDAGYVDTWKDTEARRVCDAAAASCENGDNDYWNNEDIQFDKQSVDSSAGRNARLAHQPAGALVQDAADL